MILQAEDCKKPCSSCGKTKPLEEFGVDPRMKLGRTSQCRPCRREKNQRWREKQPPGDGYRRTKEWRERNPERVREHSRKYAPSKEQSRETQRRWRERNRDEARRASRNGHLLRKFGITIEQEEAMISSQNGKCPICSEELGAEGRGYRRHVDHDHNTGSVRAVLCFHCNVGLGSFRDDPELLRAAMDYLESHTRVERVAA